MYLLSLGTDNIHFTFCYSFIPCHYCVPGGAYIRSWLSLNPNSGIYLPYASSLTLWIHVLSSCKTQGLYYLWWFVANMWILKTILPMWHPSSYKIEIFKTVLPWDQFSDFKTLTSPKVSGKLPLGLALQWEAKVTPKTLTYNKILPGCELCLTNKVEIILCEEWKGAEPSNRHFFFFFYSGEGEIILNSKNKTL